MGFLEDVIKRAKSDIKSIVLPEGFDNRIVEAASIASKEGFVNITLLGSRNQIKELAGDCDISKVNIIDYLESDKFEEYASMFYELRKEKGMSLEKARETLRDPLYFGAMMVKAGDVDGMVAGSCASTAVTLRCALQTVKTAPGCKSFSTCTILCLKDQGQNKNKVVIFSDTAMYENPTAEELSEIAVSAGKFYKVLTGDEAKIAMLSYSTYGSVKTEQTLKIVEATNLAREKAPELIVDGEMQFDAAVVAAIGNQKAPGNRLNGEANVFIFPELNSANIGCKIAERFANAELYGPVSQGLAKPINDLSRGCSATDIVGMIAITAIQAKI